MKKRTEKSRKTERKRGIRWKDKGKKNKRRNK